jgi:hypothetical protein
MSLPPAAQVPNLTLKRIRNALNMSLDEFAIALQEAGRELGEPNECNKHQVYRWESGAVRSCRPNYRRALEAVTGRRYVELGFTADEAEPNIAPSAQLAVVSRPLVVAGSDADLEYARSIGDTLATIAELGSADMQRREFVLGASFVAGALAAPSRDWLLSSLDAIASGRRRKVSPEQVGEIRRMFASFQEADVIGGGGDEVRQTVAAYLTGYVMPLVQQPQSPAVSQALYEVASEQTYLAGWMAFDSGRHGLAQRYLIQSLRLAQASGNRILGSHILAGMSDQATQLGYPEEGLSLAKAGQHGLNGVHAPAAMTDLLVLEARAHATMRNAIDAVHAIDAAERTFDEINADDEAEWARFIDEAYVTGEIANSLRDLSDSRNAEAFATQSIAACARQGRNRRASLSYAALAASHTQRNDLEAAAHAATQALDKADGVPSIRCTVALNRISNELAPYSGNQAVGDFLDRAAHA